MPLEPEPTGRRGPWRPIAPSLSASALQSASCPEWDEMVQNGTETQFFPGGQPASPSGAWPWRPIAPGLSASALHSASAPEWDVMVQNGTETQFFPARANQQASPGHGLRALLPLASLHPHCNLLAPRNGTKWYRMVRKLNFSPARQPASQSGAWPRNSAPEWDVMVQNGTETQFFPGQEYQVRQVLKAIDKLQAIND